MAALTTLDTLRSTTTRPQNYGMPGQATRTIIFAFIVIAALYFAREILMPLALAVLLSFMLAPLVRRLQKWYVPRAIAVISVVLFAFAVIFALGGVIVSQVNQLASDLPQYQTRLQDKIQSLRGVAGGPGTLERATEVLRDLSKEISRPESNQQSNARPDQPGAPTTPLLVEVREPDPGPLSTLVAVIRPLIHPLATTGLVIVFVIFILWQRQDLRNRLVRLAGSNDLNRTTNALNDAGKRLSRLFLTQLALNAFFGLVIGVAWWFIGVPSAALWGILVMILRFMPYVGTWISAIFPLLIAAAVGPDWSMFIWAATAFIVLDIFIGQVMEPMVQGHSTGLSPVAVIVSATFWTWLWGPIGLILATPITMSLAVLGRHIESMKFLDVMLGDQPALTPPELAYQRMLARDPIEVTEEARGYLKTNPVASYYQDILLGGLRLAQRDTAWGMLEEEARVNVRDSVEEVVEDLGDHVDAVTAPAPTEESEKPLAHISQAEKAMDAEIDDLPAAWRAEGAVMCVPGDGVLDHALAVMISNLIERKGLGVRTAKESALSMSQIFSLDTKDTLLICVCYLDDVTPAQARYVVRRLRRKAPHAQIVISLMGETANFAAGEPYGMDVVFVKDSLQATVDAITAVALVDRAVEAETNMPLPDRADQSVG
jgi:predicted PurR-regulated permease PerM